MIALLSSYLNTPMRDNSVLFRLLATSCMLVSLTTLAPEAAHAEIYQCNGTWTNHPCPEGSPVFEEKVSTPSPSRMLDGQKRDAIHQLTSARYDARDKFGIDLDASDVERFCELEDTTLEQCRSSIESFRTRLDTQVLEEERRRPVQSEITPQGAIRNETNSQVIVINNYYGRTPTYAVTYPPYRPPNSGLIPQPQPRQRIPAPSRGEVPNDARVPLPHGGRR